ncbi:E3 ubiquitin-protein ligase MARCH5 [Dissostichus eleginoides]|uniref:E3 ubiquitin-protein ligase MARCH5 n=1 Tax=Dissostichus eleginoides TaxID=100907 RepID=A0AAD9F0G6_DISEL|nr:E3 ubiquitin-protein ligase MARCH5 [Dissostichus eleginoides]
MALAEETPEKPAGVLPATGGPRSDSGQSLAAVGVVVGSVYWSAVTYEPSPSCSRRPSFCFSDSVWSARFPHHRLPGGAAALQKDALQPPAHLTGGIAFVLIKGVMKVYFKQQQCTNQASRHILDYYPETQTEGQSDGAEDEDTEDSGNE